MAGDTPTPIRHDKDGASFYDGEQFDLRKAGENVVPLNMVQERRNVNEALLRHAADLSEQTARIIEFNPRIENANDMTIALTRLHNFRLQRMNPEDTPFLSEDKAA